MVRDRPGAAGPGSQHRQDGSGVDRSAPGGRRRRAGGHGLPGRSRHRLGGQVQPGDGHPAPGGGRPVAVRHHRRPLRRRSAVELPPPGAGAQHRSGAGSQPRAPRSAGRGSGPPGGDVEKGGPGRDRGPHRSRGPPGGRAHPARCAAAGAVLAGCAGGGRRGPGPDGTEDPHRCAGLPAAEGGGDRPADGGADRSGGRPGRRRPPGVRAGGGGGRGGVQRRRPYCGARSWPGGTSSSEPAM